MDSEQQEVKEHPQTGPDVVVTVDTQPKTVHRGSWVVAEFKREVGVDANAALDQVVEGVFQPLQDDQRITLRGGEVFVSHVRAGRLGIDGQRPCHS